MKTLIVTAHPSSKGFTHKIAQSYAKAIEDSGGEATIANLYKEKWQQNFLVFEDVRDITLDEQGKMIQERIEAADEIVLAFPMWWFGVPAVMKNFIDHNFRAGFAFEFVEGKPRGLFTQKSARIFVTADGPSLMYKILKPFFALPLTKGLFGFCGMKTKSIDIFADRIKWKDAEKESEVLAAVAKRAG